MIKKIILPTLLLVSSLFSCGSNNPSPKYRKVIINPLYFSDIQIGEFVYTTNYDLVGTVSEMNPYKNIVSIDLNIDEVKLVNVTDYTWKVRNGQDLAIFDLTIKKAALDKNEGTIIITPIFNGNN